MSTPTEQMNKELHAEADASKKNLSEGVSAHVPGQEAVTPGTRRDPFGDRKALFQKADTKRDGEAQTVRDNNPSVDENVRRMYEAMGQPVPGQADQSAQPAQGAQPAQPASPSTTVEKKYATLDYNGRQLSVAQSDIDAAGGQEAYLRQRRFDDNEASLAMQAEEMQKRQAELDQSAADLKRRQEEFQRSMTGGQGGPANGDGGTPSQVRNGPAAGAEADLEAEASRLVDMLFSGDPSDAGKAIKQVLAEARQNRTAMPSAEQVAELAAQKLQERTPAPRTEVKPATPAQAVDPRWERTRQSINTMSETEFPDIAKVPANALLARNRLIKLYQDPANKDRRAVDVARQACQETRAELLRQQRIEVKQGLPSTPSAGGSAPAGAGDEAVPVGKDYVAMLADRRNFGPRNR